MSQPPRDPNSILQEQQRYYSQRAPEYDAWWARRGPFDQGERENGVWFEELAAIWSVVEGVEWNGHILELAGGTGMGTVRLAPRVERLTVIDASEEMLAINRSRLEQAGLADRVEYMQADLFRWSPNRVYDGVFCGFWLSHVPSARLEAFLQAVSAATRPGGQLVIVDSRQPSASDSLSSATGGTEHVTRRLQNGRPFQIVKRYFSPTQLDAQLARHGFAAQAENTPTHFLYCVARKVGRQKARAD